MKEAIKTVNEMGSNIILLLFIDLLGQVAYESGRIQKISWFESTLLISKSIAYVIPFLFAAEANYRVRLILIFHNYGTD